MDIKVGDVFQNENELVVIVDNNGCWVRYYTISKSGQVHESLPEPEQETTKTEKGWYLHPDDLAEKYNRV